MLFFTTALTMVAFAANSVLARLALGDGFIDPASYTGIRLISGAFMLWALLRLRGRKQASASPITELGTSNWVSGLALFFYAALFSFAYLRLETGMGALILFACVQFTMIGWAIRNGKVPGNLERLGIGMAFVGFAYLVSPGLHAPSLAGAVMMAISGIAWGIYTIIGQGVRDPLRTTASNFVISVPIALLPVFSFLVVSRLDATPSGVLLAVVSGAITSGVGYALWYSVLPSLASSVAAVSQLTVPAIAALGGILFVGEPLTLRFVISSVLILGGVALVIRANSTSA